MAKRKTSSVAAASTLESNAAILPPMPARRVTNQKAAAATAIVNPNENSQVFDGPGALRASPDAQVNGTENFLDRPKSKSLLSDLSEDINPPAKKRKAAVSGSKKVVGTPKKKDDKVEEMIVAASARKMALKEQNKSNGSMEETKADPEADEEDEEADPEEIKEALARPPPVNSDYLPLPWKGRIGYACLCTYLRYSNPPVFQSRTTRIASILEHRHPLKDPSQPEHPTKNRPDKEQAPDVCRGQQYVEQLCIANVKDMGKMIRWNDMYGIKFLRLSSEAFPFASHADYGYRLAPFASEALAKVGRIAAELGHRLTTHPGQFTQLGSPREQVIKSSIRDLEYHDEFLSLLKLPEQQNRDAVMVLHMGGVFGDKAATLDRFRENYKKLPQGIKNRLVLENDDVSWSVHDLLPVCKELNIPLVLDYHHHNIIFDSDKIREGTKDIMDLYPEIRATWTRKGITQKMHYSEPCSGALTGRQRRKHSPRVATLPPCADDMDLMIEAKDKEQAVFELMRNFKLPGFEKINDMLPHIRKDDNKPVRIPKKKTPKKGKKPEDDEDIEDEEVEDGSVTVADEDVGMGGPENRVYWPPGMEEWLRPVKKVVKKKEGAAPPKSMEQRRADKAARLAMEAEMSGQIVKVEEEAEGVNGDAKAAVKSVAPATTKKAVSAKTKGRADETVSKKSKRLTTPVTSEAEFETDLPVKSVKGRSRTSARSKPAKITYTESEDGDQS